MTAGHSRPAHGAHHEPACPGAHHDPGPRSAAMTSGGSAGVPWCQGGALPAPRPRRSHLSRVPRGSGPSRRRGGVRPTGLPGSAGGIEDVGQGQSQGGGEFGQLRLGGMDGAVGAVLGEHANAGGADTGPLGKRLRVQVTTAHALLQQLRKVSHPLLLPGPDPFIRFGAALGWALPAAVRTARSRAATGWDISRGGGRFRSSGRSLATRTPLPAGNQAHIRVDVGLAHRQTHCGPGEIEVLGDLTGRAVTMRHSGSGRRITVVVTSPGGKSRAENGS